MERYVFSILLLILTEGSASSTDDGFLISAPGLFHVGVNEKVFVQMGKTYLNIPVTLYLEHETSATIVSQKKTTQCTAEGEVKTVELMIDKEKMSRFPKHYEHSYLLLVANFSDQDLKKTHVLVSKRKGNIFIQTDQPIYDQMQKVKYRIFTLDHSFRPHDEVFQISVFNAAGNRVIKSLKTAKGGILQDSFFIPDVSKYVKTDSQLTASIITAQASLAYHYNACIFCLQRMGTWKITAHYVDDEANAASREFKVQKFVLPSFEVNIAMEQRYVLLSAEQLNFTITARYSHGEKVKGAYHCQFGIVKKGKAPGQKIKPDFIRGLELTGSVTNGTATAALQISDLQEHFQKQQNGKLSDLTQSGARLYLGVFVTNVQSGEIQEAEVYLPIVSNKYTIDVSRTRRYFHPGYPLDMKVIIRLPDGSPAAGVPVKIDVLPSSEESWQGITDQEGAVFPVFNILFTLKITFGVSIPERS